MYLLGRIKSSCKSVDIKVEMFLVLCMIIDEEIWENEGYNFISILRCVLDSNRVRRGNERGLHRQVHNSLRFVRNG